jgi:ketosteroid isomerase-like protein
MRGMDAVRSIDSPARISEAFVDAINAGDLPGALALYRDDAVLLAPDGECARGAKAIEELLGGLVAMQVEMEIRIENVIEAGEIAVASEAWTMRPRAPDGGAPHPDGASSEQHGQSIVLFTRGADGWRFLIDAPWGL